MDKSTTRAVLAAVIISSILHLILLFCFMMLHVGHLVIPAERKRTFRPFEIHQAEIPPQALREDPEPLPDKVATLQPPAPPKHMPEPGKIMDPSLLVNTPRPIFPDLPTGGVSDIAPKIVAPPVNLSPFLPSEQAKITSEVSKFVVEPDYGAMSVVGGKLPTTDPNNVNTGMPLPGTNGKETSGVGSAVPTLEQIQNQFRFTSPNIDPSLPAPVIVRLPSDILFDFDSSQLRAGADATLDLAVAYMKKFNRGDIEVDGHTDTIGDEDYNLKLSTARAETVMNWLQLKLPDPAYSWHSKGWGKSKPIVNPQGSIAEQERNRRVEIVIRAVKSN